MELLEGTEKQGLGAQCGLNSGLKFPGRLITLNFAPVDLREDDDRYGVCWLPAAMSTGRVVGYECLGELCDQPIQGVYCL